MSNQLSLKNVVNVTLATAGPSLTPFNTSNLMLISSEEPADSNFGDFRIYLGPTSVGEDFGSDAKAFSIANTVFSQQLNITTGGGALIIAPRLQDAPETAAKILSSSSVDLTTIDEEDYFLNVDVGGTSDEIDIGELERTSVTEFKNSLNAALSGSGLEVEVTGSLTSADVILKTTATGSAATLEILEATTGSDLAVALKLEGEATGADEGLETIKDAILRLRNKADFFGIIYDEDISADVVDVASIIQPINKMQFVATNSVSNAQSEFESVKDRGFTNTRCLFYSTSEDDAIIFAAAYASRGLSINFEGQNTVSTMHLKTLTGIEPDSGLDQTLYTELMDLGVDVYANIGVPKVLTSGENGFFDFIYVNIAFKLRIKVEAFNTLDQITKIPQTESGMNDFKGALRDICAQYVTNGAFAPGEWNGPVPFGNPEDFRRNITDEGYYVTSLPIAEQAQAIRELRAAPLTNIAVKGAGALHSADIFIQVQA